MAKDIPLTFEIHRVLSRHDVSPEVRNQLISLAEAYDVIDGFCQRFEGASGLFKLLGGFHAAALEEYRAKVQGTGTANANLSDLVDEQNRLRDRMSELSKWQRIPVRDAIMTLYHIEKAMGDFGSKRNKANALPLNKVTGPRNWSKLFNRAFPILNTLRNTVAHEAQEYGETEKADKNSAKGPILIEQALQIDGGTTLLRDNLVNDQLTYTKDGKVIQFKLDDDAAAQLRNSVELIRQHVLELASLSSGESAPN